MGRLREPNGCPWDREQTHESLKPFLIEETHEVIDAIERKDYRGLKEELGDLLLQIVFHAQIASEANEFDLSQVLEGIVDKLVRRHPHVFGKAEASSAREVTERWEKIKAAEVKKTSFLEGVPPSLPALLYALQIQEKAASAGFDWEKREDILAKLNEEIAEFEVACKQKKGIEEELGDLLFTLVNVARHLGLDPEEALRKASKKFKKRFERMEQAGGKKLAKMSLAEQDGLWKEAKKAQEQNREPRSIDDEND